MASWSSPRSGAWRVRWSRPIEGTPKTVTISREADGWYVCFSCADIPVATACRPPGSETGIDLGLESFATLSDGTMIHNPRCYRKAERRLKTAQRRVSRRKKGSNRRRKAVKLLAKAHLKVKRQRQDFHHKVALHAGSATTTRSITRICRWPTWSRITTSPRASADAGWSQFLSHPRSQSSIRWASSRSRAACLYRQACSGCGVLVKKGLSVRWHSCPDCGTSLHRDHNAAKNIERAGQGLRGGVA